MRLQQFTLATSVATLFLASAQVVNSLAPEDGLLHLLYCFFFAVLLWVAARIDRQHAPSPRHPRECGDTIRHTAAGRSAGG